MEKYYLVQKTPELQEQLEVVDQQKTEIDHYRPLRKDIWGTVQKKLKIDWTYDSNAIEGSTLTRGETGFFLEHGLTVEGKPFKDFLDARNHAEAIDFLYSIIQEERPITEGVIKEFNALILSGVNSTPAINQEGKKIKKPATPGEYKKLPNHVLQPDGTIFYYVEPLQVAGEMSRLIQWINQSIDGIHSAIVGAVAHYNMVRIHPFDDGNGRVSRILMNLILIKKGFSPAIVKMEQRRKYLDCLKSADQGNLNPFIEFVIQSLANTQSLILEELT